MITHSLDESFESALFSTLLPPSLPFYLIRLLSPEIRVTPRFDVVPWISVDEGFEHSSVLTSYTPPPIDLISNLFKMARTVSVYERNGRCDSARLHLKNMIV